MSDYQSSKTEAPLMNKEERKQMLFNNTLNTFYLRLFGVGHMSNEDSVREDSAILSD